VLLSYLIMFLSTQADGININSYSYVGIIGSIISITICSSILS